MNKEIIYNIKAPYRDSMRITGYHFGGGDKSVAVVGAIRGNEVQQLYICSLLVNTLKELEQAGNIVKGKEILVIPSVNHYSMNIGKRFWAVDNTDINRMFPGYNGGETTQRIAAGLFQTVSEYRFGIQFASFYMPGDFVPHIRMMETGYQNSSLANLFGLPYVILRTPTPFDTTTLNYNWQIWDTAAFSVYTKETDEIDEASAHMAVSAVLRFLNRMGIIKYRIHSGYIPEIIQEKHMVTVHASKSGIYRRKISPGQEVHKGDVLAEIMDPYEGIVKETIVSPVNGVIFFAHKKHLMVQRDVICRIIPDAHKL